MQVGVEEPAPEGQQRPQAGELLGRLGGGGLRLAGEVGDRAAWERGEDVVEVRERIVRLLGGRVRGHVEQHQSQAGRRALAVAPEDGVWLAAEQKCGCSVSGSSPRLAFDPIPRRVRESTRGPGQVDEACRSGYAPA